MAQTKRELSKKKKRRFEIFIEYSIKISAILVIISLCSIFVFVSKEALPIFTSPEIRKEVPIRKFIQPYEVEGKKQFIWQPVSEEPKYSFVPMILGTLRVTFVALIIAIPLSILAAVYTSEFAPPVIRETVKPVVELLAGIPSVVIGSFAFLILSTWLQDIFGWKVKLNAITAGIGLSFAVIPIIYTVAEDALTSVPRSFREGSIALGANRWQTAWRVALPAALPGIFASCVLGFGRAWGETMIVVMASGNAATSSFSLTESVRKFSATIAQEMGEVVVGSPHYHILFLIGALLFIFTYALNMLGQLYIKRLQARLEGKR